jgi:hemerythrin-like domain-containing protein
MQDHHALERTFADLSLRANEGDWKDLDEVWSGFAADLERHLKFEEEQLFSGFAARDAASATIVDELRRDHAAIRTTCEQFGIQIQLHQIRATEIDAFLDLLRRHAAREDETLYPWVDARAA